VKRPAVTEPGAPQGARPGWPKPARASGGDAIPLPTGFSLRFDQGTKQLGDGSLFGGSPARVLKLTAAGSAALAELRAGPVSSPAAATLARRLTDGGLAHPIPPAAAAADVTAAAAADVTAAAAADVTVVIPVRDRARLLDRCLAAVAQRYPVIVVDDGSADPEAIAAVAARHGAILRRREVNGGAGPARNTGLAGVTTSLIAFLDSDCVPAGDWIAALAPHFRDPLVGAVAPRIVAPPASGAAPSAAVRYAAVRGSLDLGGSPARVRPGGRVTYVPTAALLVRREALAGMAAHGTEVFDPALRFGEDVDLIWRLHDAGWRIRYDPAVEVPHDGPATWPGLLERRFWYGTSAGPLARRHPANMAPLVLQPWPAVTVAALLARRPALAAAAATAGWLHLTDMVRRAGVPADGAAAATGTAVRQTWLGIGRYATQFAAPALVVALARPGGKTRARRWGRRAAAASLLLGPALTSFVERKPDLDPVRFTLGQLADDICYGAGVWTGCLRERTIVPVRPAISWRMFRVSGPHWDRNGAPSQQAALHPGKNAPHGDERD
jgi:mycofactocin glycosyltransferase